MATPTPMPAFAPVDRPLLDAGAAEAVTVVVVNALAVGVEVGVPVVPVALGRPNVDCLMINDQHCIAYLIKDGYHLQALLPASR